MQDQQEGYCTLFFTLWPYELEEALSTTLSICKIGATAFLALKSCEAQEW